MKLADKVSLFLLLASPALVAAQIAPGAHSTGTCSPAVAGTGNVVTITCSETEKANQIIKLINKLLAEHIDISEVNHKLDSIGAEISVLNVSQNPLAHVSPELLKLYDDAELIYTSCSQLHTEWIRLASTPTAANGKLAPANNPMFFYQNYAETMADIKSQRLQEYRRALLPRLLALDAKVHRLVGQPVSSVSVYETPNAGVEVSLHAKTLNDLVDLYESRQVRAGNPQDPALEQESATLVRDCSAFGQAWTQALTLAMQPPAPTPQATTEIDLEEMRKYHTLLENELVSLQKEAQPLVPGYKSTVNYAKVKNPADLQVACEDIHAIEEAYRRKLTIQVMENASHAQTSKPATHP